MAGRTDANCSDVRNVRYINTPEVAKGVLNGVFSPPDVDGRPDRSPGQASGKRAKDRHPHRGARIRASGISYHH